MTAPSEMLLEADLVHESFSVGEADGRWTRFREGVQGFPFVFTRISVAQRPNSPDALLVRWEVDDYGTKLISGSFWDLQTNNFLQPGSWPKFRAESWSAKVFRTKTDWARPGKAFYHPWDRYARPGHPDWEKLPEWSWDGKRIGDFVDVVHCSLNDGDYLGC